MRETGAVFGGEHSRALLLPRLLGRRQRHARGDARARRVRRTGWRRSRSSPRAFTPYSLSGEINSIVDDVPAAYTRIVEAFTGRAEFDEFDGLTVTGITAESEPFWWFNVRPSNTEPLLRLNVEGADAATMAAVRDEVLALIRS